jgi:hypothetical protein
MASVEMDMQSCTCGQGHSEQLSCAKLGIVVDGACEFRYWKDIQIPNNTYNTKGQALNRVRVSVPT